MKVTIISALLALVACQLADARVVATNNETSIPCAADLLVNFRTRLFAGADNIWAQLDAIHSGFDECQTLPAANESEACLSEFYVNAVASVENLYSDVVASQDDLYLYALDLLPEYLGCRSASYVQVMTSDHRETLCALYLYREVREQFASYIALVATGFGHLQSSFYACNNAPTAEQAQCLISVYDEAQVTWQNAVALFEQPEFFYLGVLVLDDYNTCMVAE